MGYSDYTDIKNSLNFTTATDAITPNGSGIYDITYTILTTSTVGTFSYGGETSYYSGSTEADTANSHFHNLTTPQTDALDYIFSPGDYTVLFGDVAPITFSSSSSGAIAIGQASSNNTGTFFGDPMTTDLTTVAAKTFISEASPSSAATYADVWLNSNFQDSGHNSLWTDASPGTEGFIAILHELGHSMGLVHPSTYADWNSQQYTIMSNVGSADVDVSVLPSGLQMYDILALQSIYGINWGGDRGEGGMLQDTVYSIGNGFGATADKAFLYTIWDGGGTDVIDATGYGVATQIDLRQGHFSSIGLQEDSGSTAVPTDDVLGDRGNVGVAYYTVIENAIGTDHGDTIIGNEWDNVLYGGEGNDSIYGDGISYDQTTGFEENFFADASSTVYHWGPDNIAPATDDSGNDILIGGAGNDLFYGGEGNDIIHGGYVQSDIDSAYGGSPGDWDAAAEFTGTNNEAATALSDISWDGNGTADGFDTITYAELSEGTSSSAGVHVTFDNTDYTSPTTVVKGYGGEYGTDTLFSVERVIGTNWNDVFDGTSQYISGTYASLGNDTYSVGTNFFSVDYSSLDARGTNAHITVTASGSGLTIDKADDNGSLGEDTTSVADAAIDGTSGNDSFTGYINGEGVYYVGGAGSDTYSFDMTGLLSGTHTADVHIEEDAGGSINNISVTTVTTIELASYATGAGTLDATFNYFHFDSGTSTNDELTIYYYQTGVSAVQSFNVGGTTFELGTYADDVIVAASGDHVVEGGGGTNTIDYHAATGGVTANLNTGTVSNNGWGYTDTLADVSVIIGSHHNDTITGDGSTTTVSYTDATGGVTVDLYSGAATGDGSDTFTDVTNAIGSAYDDLITSDANDNTIDGGAGNDTISYANASSAVTVDLTMGTATGDGSDTLVNIENVIGSIHDDSLTGGPGNRLAGGEGNDTLAGGIADYSSDPAGVTLDLSMGTATDGWSDADTLTDIHAAIGSAYADTLTAAGNDDLLAGGQGNDTIIGGTADYSHDPAGVTVNLSMGTATDGWSDTDTLSGVHNVVGSAHADTITGDSNDNVISGGAGNDTLDGGGGFNTVDYSHDFASVSVDLSMGTATDGWSNTDTLSNFQAIAGSHFDDTLTGDGTSTVSYAHALQGVTVDLGAGTATGDGNDTLSGIANVIGSAYDDVIYGGTSGQNIVEGGAGNDTLDGSYGSTFIVDYSHDPSGITADFSIGTVSDGYGGTDSVSASIVIGSHYDDSITGDGGIYLSYQTALSGVTIDVANGTATGDGDDTFSSLGGMIGSTHDDIFYSDTEYRTLDGGGGIDTISYENYTAGVTVDLSSNYASADGVDSLTDFANVNGSAYADIITGNDDANVLYGAGDNDYFTGDGGADTFLFKGATAFTGTADITDFSTGDGDKIDLTDVLTGHYDPVTDAIADFVSVSTSGSNTLLYVDLDGTGVTHSPTQIAVLQGVTGLNVSDMITNGNLVVPT